MMYGQFHGTQSSVPAQTLQGGASSYAATVAAGRAMHPGATGSEMSAIAHTINSSKINISQAGTDPRMHNNTMR